MRKKSHKKQFNKEAVFAEVDKSNQRFENYTSEERKTFSPDLVEIPPRLEEALKHLPVLMTAKQAEKEIGRTLARLASRDIDLTDAAGSIQDCVDTIKDYYQSAIREAISIIEISCTPSNMIYDEAWPALREKLKGFLE